MPSKASAAKLKALQRRVNHLRYQASQLVQARSLLVQKHALLDALCQTFTSLQASVDAIDTHVFADRLDELSELEGSLLAQLQQLLHSSNSTQAASQETSSDLGISTIAPRGDPLAYLKHHLSLSPSPVAATITPAELATLYKEVVLEASMQLHLMQVGVPVLQDDCKDRLEQLWQRYLHVTMSLVCMGKPHVLEEMALFNLTTMSFEQDSAPKHAAQVAAMPPLLDLTEQQVQEISAGTGLFMKLLGSIMREQQQLHAELLASESSAGPTCSSDSSGSNQSSSSSLGSVPESLHGIHQDLDGHQRSTCRMQVLLRKEYFMRAAAVGWFLGCLDWKQVTKACIMGWPYPLRTTLLAEEIARYAAGQQWAGRAARAADADGEHWSP